MTTDDHMDPTDHKVQPTSIFLPPLCQRALHHAQQTGRRTIVRLPAPKPWKNPWDLAALALHSGQDATVWADPDDSATAVGIGAALQLHEQGPARFARLQDAVEALHHDTFAHDELKGLPLWFGGFAFDDASQSHREHTHERWTAWPDAYLVTHRITAVKTPQRSYIVLTFVLDATTTEDALYKDYLHAIDIVDQCRALAARYHQAAVDPALRFRDDSSFAAWQRGVHHAVEAIDAGQLQKVVLARSVFAPWPTDSDDASSSILAQTPVPARVLPALHRMKQRYQHCTTFALMRPDGDDASLFFGSTPELLVARQHQRIQTMALAGTAARGTNADDDKKQISALLGSPKERQEHRFVVEDILQSLQRIDVTVRASSVPDVVSFPNVHHLCTPIHGPADTPIGLLPLADALHPTPAICGTQTDAALQWLREHEDLDRGWYAGGVVWMNDRSEGRVSVALRSGLATKEGVFAFAGAGIVHASDAQKEWDETRAKLSSVCDAFATDDNDRATPTPPSLSADPSIDAGAATPRHRS